MYRYRIASLQRDRRKFSVVMIDYVKNHDNQIIAINNNKNMILSFDDLKSAKDYISSNKTIDFSTNKFY